MWNRKKNWGGKIAIIIKQSLLQKKGVPVRATGFGTEGCGQVKSL